MRLSDALPRSASLLATVLLPLLSGCSSLGYYWQSVHGHLEVMRAARPIDDWLQDPATPPALKARLELARHIRAFAVSALDLPDNASYHRYADLHRSSVIWNVTAAEPFSLDLHTWCFPITGCIGYRGYFDVADARAEAQALQAQGLETFVYGVPAYSTLGWMNWAGGDPLLNTVVDYPDGELAQLIFHELAHQVVYVDDDTTFNESFATAVERLGVREWLAREASPEARAAYAALEVEQQQFRTLTRQVRQQLQALYAQETPPDQPPGRRQALKEEAMADFRARYASLRQGWHLAPQRQAAYDQWVARANNAAFGTLSAYDALVPAFEALFRRQGGSGREAWTHFYDAVRHLAALPDGQRLAALARETPATPENRPETELDRPNAEPAP